MEIRPDVELANMSDVGCVRQVNEDYFAYVEPQDQLEFDRRGRLLMVADGMGGHKGGQVASSLAVDVVRNKFLEADSDDARSVLIDSFQAAHRTIIEASHDSTDLDGMGTTCCAAILKNGQLVFGSIGDSRLYLIREGSVQPLTEDHTVVNALIKQGVLSPEEARHHEQRNVLTAALGSEASTIAGDFNSIPVQAGDTFLMCSDGLHGLVTDQEMGEVVDSQPLTDACRQLIELAKDRGGPDNITVQLLRVRDIPT
jgi:serine/threonine protein phosphatase PrpC